ncbi:hypothetical protein KKG19_01650 [Patescibacteria group bacterium]|nr:hypothetical protein [Patescibacteria group bacterium]
MQDFVDKFRGSETIPMNNISETIHEILVSILVVGASLVMTGLGFINCFQMKLFG